MVGQLENKKPHPEITDEDFGVKGVKNIDIQNNLTHGYT